MRAEVDVLEHTVHLDIDYDAAIAAAYERGKRAEREACLAIAQDPSFYCDDGGNHPNDTRADTADRIAAAIRRRT